MAVKDTNITRTTIANLIQTNMMAGRPHPILPGTSLNQLWQIHQDAVIAKGEYPLFGYYAIGDRGHTSTIIGENDDVAIDLFKHDAADQACWRHVPFVMRPEGSDLSVTEQAQYAGRTYEEWNGTWYWCYYLKRLDLTDLIAQILKISVVGGVEVPETYTYDETNLHPKRPSVPPDSAVTASDDYYTVSMPFTIEFSALDAQELQAVAAIRYGDTRRAIVSEILFVGGVDRSIETDGDGGKRINFKEAVGTQALTHLTTYHQMSISTRGFTIDMELGSNEPINADDGGSSLNAQATTLATARALNITSATTRSN